MLTWILGVGLAVAGDVFKPVSTGDESYGETFTAFADLEDGSYLLLQFLFTNAGFGDGKAACRLLSVPKGTSGSNSSINASSSEWQHTTNSLTINDCKLSTSGGKTTFTAKTDKGSASVTFAAAPKRHVPPKHKLTAGKEFWEGDLLIPFASVTATMNGKNLSGKAQLDHTRSNTLLPKVSKRWIRYRGFYGEAPIMLQIHDSPTGKRSAWIFYKGQFTTVANSDLQLSKVNGSGVVISVKTAAGTLSIETSAKIYEYKPTEAYGALGSLAQPWVGNPVTTTWRATSTLEETTIKGIVEVAAITD